MPFPTSFIQELKARNPIEQVISRHIELKRSGSNLSGLCPFHSEKSPSFTVFSDHFHCFGCGAGGDVITFVMRMENLEYRDAVQSLADRCGLAVPEYNGNVKVRKSALTRERAFLMNKLAAKHFHLNLKSPDAKNAVDYLNERKLARATVVHFGLGYAKNSFNDLTDYLVSEGFSVEEIKENFLCGISQKNGRPFDMFRNRIIIPIIDTSGNVIAFGGRVLDDSKPKYLNSSDTVVFKKSRNLFALNFAKNSVLGDGDSQNGYMRPGELIVCEGYMDVIAMHQAGFQGAVATLGTAITSEHARLISRYAKTVYLAYDSDSAGQTATGKAIQMLSEVGIDAKVLKIEGAKDPDEYIKKFGASSFAKVLGASEGQIDYRLNKILGKYDLTLSDEQYKAVAEACTMLAGIQNDLKREVYVKRLSEMSKISADTINSEIKRCAYKERRRIRKNFSEEIQRKSLGYNDRINPEAAVKFKETTLEQRILGIIMLYPEFLETETEINEDIFVTAFNKTLFQRIKQLAQSEQFDISALNEFYTPSEMSYILEMKEARQKLSANGKDVLSESAELLKKLRTSGTGENAGSFLENIEKIRAEKMKGC